MNSRGQGGSQRYAEVWEDRFGAIAVDYKNERSGAAENQKTKHAAERAALKDCASRECKVVSSGKKQLFGRCIWRRTGGVWRQSKTQRCRVKGHD